MYLKEISKKNLYEVLVICACFFIASALIFIGIAYGVHLPEFLMWIIIITLILIPLQLAFILQHKRRFPSLKKYPEVVAHVEVVDNAVFVVPKELNSVRYDFYAFSAFFRFPDGSEKHFEVPEELYYLLLGNYEKYSNHMQNINKKINASKRWYKRNKFQKGFYCEEGESISLSGAGKLTYKEVKNIERRYGNDVDRCAGRLFVNFEPDVPNVES